MITALLVIGILVLLIVTHELGHFIAAKIFGVRVEEFGVGYPPRAFLLGTFHGTQYTLNWIPFGGFVRLYGEDANTGRGRGSFTDAPYWKQAIILIAGVTVNALVAWLLFAGALASGIPRVITQDSPHQDPASHLIVSDVIAGSPAATIGIVAGDQVLSIIDTSGMGVASLTPDVVSSFVQRHGGKKLTITYKHAGTTTSSVVIPANAVIPSQAGRAALGVGLVEVSTIALPWSDALREGADDTLHAFQTIGDSLWQLFSSAFKGRADLTDVVGPVGLVGVVNDAAQSGMGNVLALAGFIGVNLAVINLIPIPALDGGRLLIVILEAITRRRAPKVAVQLLNTVGIALIIILMLTVTYHDIARLLI